MPNRKSGKIVKRWAILPLVGVGTFILTEIGAANPEQVELFYAQGIYPVLATVLSFFSNIFAFSIDDVFYSLLILFFLVVLACVILRKIALVKAGKLVLNMIAVVYTLFYLFWGFNYYRQDLNTRLNIEETEPDANEFLSQLKSVVEQTNQSFCTMQKLDKMRIDSLVEASYNDLKDPLNIRYPSGLRKDKSITYSRFFAKAGISGYFGPFFNEVHVNTMVLPLEYPFVLAHEKAHQFGITSEAEANFYAWLVCTNSSSKQLQYPANLHILRFFFYQGYQLEGYREIISRLDNRVKVDFRRIEQNWRSLRDEKVDRVATKVNDTYLKTNKIEKGIEDYTGVVKFIMDASTDRSFQQKLKL